MPQVNKKALARNGNSVQTKKLGLEWTTMELGKPFKKSDPKNKKTVKIKVKLPHEQKTTVFSLYSKTTANKIYAAKPLTFLLHLLFRRDQNYYSNLT